MTPKSWYYERADDQGFTTFADLRKRALRTTRDRFVQAFPLPALLVRHDQEDSAEQESQDASDKGLQLLTATLGGYAVLRYLNRVAFVCKRPGNPYAHLVSVGRSASNDIVIAVESVSKFHGYFSSDGDEHLFTDHNSTNGSLLNHQPIESGQKNVLHDGDLLQIGVDVTLEFLSPEGLFGRLMGNRQG